MTKGFVLIGMSKGTHDKSKMYFSSAIPMSCGSLLRNLKNLTSKNRRVFKNQNMSKMGRLRYGLLIFVIDFKVAFLATFSESDKFVN